MAWTARAASGLALAIIAPMGVRTPGTGPVAVSLVALGSGACTVRRALPNAESTVANAGAGDGSFLPEGVGLHQRTGSQREVAPVDPPAITRQNSAHHFR